MSLFAAGFAAFYTLDAAVDVYLGKIGPMRPLIGLVLTAVLLLDGVSQ